MKLETENDRTSPFNSIKNDIDIEIFSHDDERSKESCHGNGDMKSQTSLPYKVESKKPIKYFETLINPNFNLGNEDNIFYYLYNYVKEERKIIDEKKNKEFNGEQISNFKIPPKPIGTQKKLMKVGDQILEKTKFLQDSIRTKFRENQEKINMTSEKDILVKDFAKKHISSESIKNLLEKEFSYY